MGTTSRRRALGLVGAAAAGELALAACGHQKAAATPAPPAATGPATIMLIRHAEKPTGSGRPYGITADGDQDDKSLTVRGWTRAGALVALFAPATGDPRPGLLRPAAVYASDPGNSGSKRPAQTVSAVAARLGAQTNTRYAKGQEAALAAELAASSGSTLVGWQHEAIPAIVANLGPVQPAPPASWPDDRFDVVWVFTRAANGWSFSQVPQRLLDGDLETPIS